MLFELDIRKFVGLKSKVNKVDWCALVAGSVKGPFLLIQEGGYVCASLVPALLIFHKVEGNVASAIFAFLSFLPNIRSDSGFIEV